MKKGSADKVPAERLKRSFPEISVQRAVKRNDEYVSSSWFTTTVNHPVSGDLHTFAPFDPLYPEGRFSDPDGFLSSPYFNGDLRPSHRSLSADATSILEKSKSQNEHDSNSGQRAGGHQRAAHSFSSFDDIFRSTSSKPASSQSTILDDGGASVRNGRMLLPKMPIPSSLTTTTEVPRPEDKHLTVASDDFGCNSKLRFCHNCMTIRSPQWRSPPPEGATLLCNSADNGDDDDLFISKSEVILCNACGLYFRLHSKHRDPSVVKKARLASRSQLKDSASKQRLFSSLQALGTIWHEHQDPANALLHTLFTSADLKSARALQGMARLLHQTLTRYLNTDAQSEPKDTGE